MAQGDWRSPLYANIEVVSVNRNKNIKNWYDSNVRSLAQILSDKMKYESTLETKRENPVINYRIDNSGKAVSK